MLACYSPCLSLLPTALRVHGNEGVRGGGVAMAGVATLEQASVAWGVASQRAGGVDVVSGADATLTSVEVADCRAVTSGGGIAVTNSQLSVMDVQVLRCAAGTSGGLRGPRTLAGPVAAARHMARAAV